MCGEEDRISGLFDRRLIATETLLTTKLYVPRAHPNLVPRPRLGKLLTEGMSLKLTLISAPAGFGKTTLLSEWRMMHLGNEYPLAWISLEKADNDPMRFLSYNSPHRRSSWADGAAVRRRFARRLSVHSGR